MSVDKFGRYSHGVYNKSQIKKGIINTLHIKLGEVGNTLDVQGKRIVNVGEPDPNQDLNAVTVKFLTESLKNIVANMEKSFNKDIEALYTEIKNMKSAIDEDLKAQWNFYVEKTDEMQSYIFNHLIDKPLTTPKTEGVLTKYE